MIRTSLCGLTATEIFDLIAPEGFNISHAISISHSVYKKRLNDISHFPRIPGSLKLTLERISDPGMFQPDSNSNSSDGTIKYFFRNPDGLEYETVYLTDKKRNTVCVSAQS